MPDVFISYAREDYDAVSELVHELERHDLTVFYDRQISPGDRFEDVIEASLDDSSCIVVLWSQASVGSRWVKAEAESGANRGILIPIKIEDVHVPLAFRALETADLIGWPERSNAIGIHRIVRSVQELLNRSPASRASNANVDEPSLSVRVADRVIQGLKEAQGENLEIRRRKLAEAFALSLLALQRGAAFSETLARLVCDAGAILQAHEQGLVLNGASVLEYDTGHTFSLRSQSRVALHQRDNTWLIHVSASPGNEAYFSGSGAVPEKPLIESIEFLADILSLHVN